MSPGREPVPAPGPCRESPWYEPPAWPYYETSFAGTAYEGRLRAVERAVPPGSDVLDVGCNDGRIARHLLGSGHARSVIAVDVQNLMAGRPPPNLVFVQADVCDLDLRSLGPADAVLALNVLHRYWGDDVEMWDDLFEGATRRAIFRYSAMSGGYRIMWELRARAGA